MLLSKNLSGNGVTTNALTKSVGLTSPNQVVDDYPRNSVFRLVEPTRSSFYSNECFACTISARNYPANSLVLVVKLYVIAPIANHINNSSVLVDLIENALSLSYIRRV